MGKCNKTHGMGKVWEIHNHTFSIAWVLFYHPIPILCYTSTYGKCMGFPINFPHYGKMQQNPWYGESLGNRYLYFSHSMGAFFPLDSHSMIYFIIWEMHGFPHQFLIVRENATKRIVLGEPGKLVLILFPYYGRIFSIRFPFYGILHHKGNACLFSLISHNLGKYSQNHRMGKVWEIGSQWRTWEIGTHTFPIVWVLFPIRFTFYGILYNM